MSGFHRGTQRSLPRREYIRDKVTEILCLEDVSARTMREADPFLVADPCPCSPRGHQTIVSCGEVVCWHCAKIFWR